MCLCGDCWREAEQTWRNGIEEFEEEIGMVLKLGGSVMRVGREISVSEMVKIFCCFCSSRQCFFFFCAWIAHLTRSLHSTSSLLIFFGQRWCHCTCRLVCRLLYSVYGIISFFMQCIVYVWILSWSIIINWYIIYTYNKENKRITQI